MQSCDTADCKSALLSAASVREDICEIRVIRGQNLYGFWFSEFLRVSNFAFRISLVLGGWSLELLILCGVSNQPVSVGNSDRSAGCNPAIQQIANLRYFQLRVSANR